MFPLNLCKTRLIFPYYINAVKRSCDCITGRLLLPTEMFPAYAPGVKGASTSYNGLYVEAPRERGTFFRLEV